jgi:hypothetical protein
MSPEPHPIDLDTPSPQAVVEFGPEPAPRRRWSTTGWWHGVATDRRLVPVSAALGAVTVLASLISEWQVTTVDSTPVGDGEVGDRMLTTGATDLGALGTGFLVGLFPLIAAVVLTMFGPPSGRRYLRLTGLSVGGTQLGLLVALTASLHAESRAIPRIYVLQLNQDQMTIGYGRGLWCAFAGVLFALLALYVAGWHLAATSETVRDPAVVEEEPEEVWSWRRPPDADEERGPDEPLELTVAPVKPFTSLTDDRDKPSRADDHGKPG